MIKIFLGNVGSGKTASIVREMTFNKDKRITFSNIKTRNIKNQKIITRDMIVKKKIIYYKKSTNEPIYDYKLNVKFWQNQPKPINIILDEAHSLINSRRGMQKINIIVTDWLALIRRVLGADSRGHGELTLITQFPYRIDKIARDMASQIRFHICHYTKICQKCGLNWKEHSETPEPLWNCPKCNSIKINRNNFIIEVWHFKNMNFYEHWFYNNLKTYYKHYYITDIGKFFKYYNTLQWEHMFSD